MSEYRLAFTRTLRAVIQDRAVASTMIVAVILYSFFYPAAYRHQVVAFVPIAVVDQDRSGASRTLLRKVAAIRTVSIVTQVSSLAEASRLLSRGEVEGILLVSHGFERDIKRALPAQITFLGNGADLVRASAISAGLTEASAAMGADAGIWRAAFGKAPLAPPVRLVTRPLFNTREGYGSVIVPAVAILIVQQTLLIGTVLLASTRRELLGNLRGSPTELIGIGSALGAIGLTNLLYFVGFAFWIQDYPRGGNLPGLLVAAVLFTIALVMFSLLVGSFFRIREHALQVILMISLPLFFLANVSWPAEATPTLLYWLAKLAPSTAGINAMVKLNEMGASLAEVAPELLNLSLLGGVYGVLAWIRYRRRAGERSNYSLLDAEGRAASAFITDTKPLRQKARRS